MVRSIFQERCRFGGFGEEGCATTRLLGEDDAVEELDAGAIRRCGLAFVGKLVESCAATVSLWKDKWG